MSDDNVVPLKPNGIGSAIHLDPDDLLTQAKGRFKEVVIIGNENGEAVCISSDGVERTLYLIEYTKQWKLL